MDKKETYLEKNVIQLLAESNCNGQTTNVGSPTFYVLGRQISNYLLASDSR